VGEDSKLARSFERIRSIVRRGRLRNKEKTENDANTKLEKLVNEIVIKRRNEKKKFATAITAGKQYLAADFQHIPMYSSSYHVSVLSKTVWILLKCVSLCE
jgi:voltage-gated cation channel